MNYLHISRNQRRYYVSSTVSRLLPLEINQPSRCCLFIRTVTITELRSVRFTLKMLGYSGFPEATEQKDMLTEMLNCYLFIHGGASATEQW